MSSARTKPPIRELLPFVIPVFLTLAAVTSFVFLSLSSTRDAVLRDQARDSANHWSMYFRSQIPDLANAFRSGTVSPQQWQVIEAGVLSGDVFRFKLFSLQGRPFLTSDEGNTPPSTIVHEANATALSVLQSNRSTISIHAGDPTAGTPRHYAEAYVPITNTIGAVIGVMEVYVDVTLSHFEITSHFSRLMWLLPLLCGGVFLIPASGYLFLKFEAVKREEHLRATRNDTLTGVLSRAALEEEATRCLHLATVYRKPTGILFVDMDRFKMINDTLGHAAGDAYLCFVADVLADNIRPDDVLGRFGGDEFIIVLPGIHGPALLDKAQSLAAAARQQRHAGDSSYRGSLSIGAYSAQPGESYEAALHKADLALYEAKSAGRDQARLYPSAPMAQGSSSSAA